MQQPLKRNMRVKTGADAVRAKNEPLHYFSRFLLCTYLMLLVLLSGSVGAWALPNDTASGPEVGARIAEAVRVDHSPRLDGTLDDPLWQSAKLVTDFRQREPREVEPATEKTEVRILYTRHAVYFGIHCYDFQPSRIVATELRRDVSQDLDDHFEILINANHDRRGGYVFQINPLGTQSDGLIVEEQSGPGGSDFDSGWTGSGHRRPTSARTAGPRRSKFPSRP